MAMRPGNSARRGISDMERGKKKTTRKREQSTVKVNVCLEASGDSRSTEGTRAQGGGGVELN